MLEYRQGEQETHLTPTDHEISNTLQHSDGLRVSGQFRELQGLVCVLGTVSSLESDLGRNYICPSFLP